MKNDTGFLKQFHFTSLDHMTHVDNLASILEYGLLAHDNPFKKRDISNLEVNQRRSKLETIFLQKIHSYVPFYFNPTNAMLYKNKNEDIVILACSKKLILGDKTIFTNKNASSDSVSFYHDITDLNRLNWDYISSTSWYGQANEYELKQTMMAEVLVHEKVSMSNLLGMYVKDLSMKRHLMQKHNIPANNIIIKPKMFFSN